MKFISTHIISFCMLVTLAITAIWGTKLSAAEKGSSENNGETYYIVYHDDHQNIIRRDAYVENYTFKADVPFFFLEQSFNNTAWCTARITEQGVIPTGATVYHTGDKLMSALENDLNLYPVIISGKFVHFDSDGGTPVRYQFIQDEGTASRPSDPLKTGYSFGGWKISGTNTDYNFSAPVTEETFLKAAWIPKSNVEYKINIWLEKAEHPNRADLADAQAHAFDDYDYGMTITKTGTSEGAASFTSSDRSSDALKELTYFNNDRSKFPVYFYDNANDSFAQSMSEASVATTTVDPTGAAIVNVFYRRIVFKPTIGVLTTGYNGKTNTTKNWDTRYEHPTVIMRDGEMLGSAIQRAIDNGDIELSQSTIDMFKTDTTPKSCGYFGFWEVTGYSGFTCGYNTNFPEGGLWAQDVTSELVYVSQNAVLSGSGSTNNSISDEFTLYVLMPRETKSGNEFRRYYYAQTLGAALNNRTDVLATQNAIANPDTNYELSNTYISYKPGKTTDGFQESNELGFTLYQTQNVKRNADGTINAVNFADSRTGGNYKCYDPDGYLLEVFYKRNSYTVDFHTGTSKVNVRSNSKFSNIFYEEPLSNIVSLIVTTDGDAFVIDNTTYTSDDHKVFVFKGWYDNAACAGSPVDFATTKMPSHNISFYAKWVEKSITVTFDANGGIIEGNPSYVMEIYSGQNLGMEYEPESPFPGRVMFGGWLLDGVVFDLDEPVYEQTELVAMYYTDPENPFKITYKSGSGTGEDVVEYNEYGYLYNANAGVKDFFPDWAVPDGLPFRYWQDADNNKYIPGDEIIVKKDLVLTGIYAADAFIVITREGLHKGESAIYDVYREGSIVMRVTLTGTSIGNDPAAVSRRIKIQEPGTYTVVETNWGWSYAKGVTTVTNGATSQTSSVNGTGTGTLDFGETVEFTFTGALNTESVDHDEDVKINKFGSSPGR